MADAIVGSVAAELGVDLSGWVSGLRQARTDLKLTGEEALRLGSTVASGMGRAAQATAVTRTELANLARGATAAVQSEDALAQATTRVTTQQVELARRLLESSRASSTLAARSAETERILRRAGLTAAESREAFAVAQATTPIPLTAGRLRTREGAALGLSNVVLGLSEAAQLATAAGPAASTVAPPTARSTTPSVALDVAALNASQAAGFAQARRAALSEQLAPAATRVQAAERGTQLVFGSASGITLAAQAQTAQLTAEMRAAGRAGAEAGREIAAGFSAVAPVLAGVSASALQLATRFRDDKLSAADAQAALVSYGFKAQEAKRAVAAAAILPVAPAVPVTPGAALLASLRNLSPERPGVDFNRAFGEVGAGVQQQRVAAFAGALGGTKPERAAPPVVSPPIVSAPIVSATYASNLRSALTADESVSAFAARRTQAQATATAYEAFGAAAQRARVGGYHASEAIAAGGSAADGAGGKVRRLASEFGAGGGGGGLAGALGTVVSRAASFALAIAGFESIRGLAHLVRDLFLVNSAIEQSRIGIAQIITTSGQYVDAFRKPLPFAQQLALAQQEATVATKALLDTAIRLGLPFEQLVHAYGASVGAFKAAGVDAAQAVPIVAGLAVVGQKLGIPQNILARDIRDAVLGLRVQQTLLGASLGLNQQAIQQAREQGKLAEYFTELLKGPMQLAATENLKTWQGLTTAIHSSAQALSLQVGASAFEALKGTLASVLHSMERLRDSPEVLAQIAEAMKLVAQSAGVVTTSLVGWGIILGRTGQAAEHAALSFEDVRKGREALAAGAPAGTELAGSLARATGQAPFTREAAQGAQTLAAPATQSQVPTEGLDESAGRAILRQQIDRAREEVTRLRDAAFAAEGTASLTELIPGTTAAATGETARGEAVGARAQIADLQALIAKGEETLAKEPFQAKAPSEADTAKSAKALSAALIRNGELGFQLAERAARSAPSPATIALARAEAESLAAAREHAFARRFNPPAAGEEDTRPQSLRPLPPGVGDEHANATHNARIAAEREAAERQLTLEKALALERVDALQKAYDADVLGAEKAAQARAKASLDADRAILDSRRRTAALSLQLLEAQQKLTAVGDTRPSTQIAGANLRFAAQQQALAAEREDAARAVEDARQTAALATATVARGVATGDTKAQAEGQLASIEANKALQTALATASDLNLKAQIAVAEHAAEVATLRDEYLHLGDTVKSVGADILKGIAFGTGSAEFAQAGKRAGEAFFGSIITAALDKKVGEFDPKIKKNLFEDIPLIGRLGGKKTGEEFADELTTASTAGLTAVASPQTAAVTPAPAPSAPAASLTGSAAPKAQPEPPRARAALNAAETEQAAAAGIAPAALGTYQEAAALGITPAQQGIQPATLPPGVPPGSTLLARFPEPTATTGTARAPSAVATPAVTPIEPTAAPSATPVVETPLSARALPTPSPSPTVRIEPEPTATPSSTLAALQTASPTPTIPQTTVPTGTATRTLEAERAPSPAPTVPETPPPTGTPSRTAAAEQTPSPSVTAQAPAATSTPERTASALETIADRLLTPTPSVSPTIAPPTPTPSRSVEALPAATLTATPPESSATGTPAAAAPPTNAPSQTDAALTILSDRLLTPTPSPTATVTTTPTATASASTEPSDRALTTAATSLSRSTVELHDSAEATSTAAHETRTAVTLLERQTTPTPSPTPEAVSSTVTPPSEAPGVLRTTAATVASTALQSAGAPKGLTDLALHVLSGERTQPTVKTLNIAQATITIGSATLNVPTTGATGAAVPTTESVASTLRAAVATSPETATSAQAAFDQFRSGTGEPTPTETASALGERSAFTAALQTAAPPTGGGTDLQGSIQKIQQVRQLYNTVSSLFSGGSAVTTSGANVSLLAGNAQATNLLAGAGAFTSPAAGSAAGVGTVLAPSTTGVGVGAGAGNVLAGAGISGTGAAVPVGTGTVLAPAAAGGGAGAGSTGAGAAAGGSIAVTGIVGGILAGAAAAVTGAIAAGKIARTPGLSRSQIYTEAEKQGAQVLGPQLGKVIYAVTGAWSDQLAKQGTAGEVAAGFLDPVNGIIRAFSQQKTTETFTRRTLANVLGDLGIPQVTAGGTKGLDLRAFGQPGGPQIPQPADYASIQGAGVGLGTIFAGNFPKGLGRGIFDAPSIARGVLNNAAALKLSAEDAQKQITDVTKAIGGADFGRAVLQVQAETGSLGRFGAKSAFKPTLDQERGAVADLTRAYFDLPKAIDAAILATVALDSQGRLHIEALKRAVEDANKVIGQGIPEAFKALVADPTFVTGSRSLAETFTSTFIERVGQQLTATTIAPLLTKAVTEEVSAASALAAGDQATATALLAQAKADFTEGRKQFLTVAQPIATQVRSFGLGLTLGSGPGVVNQTQQGLTFDGGGVVPGPAGEPYAATVHGRELVLTPAQQTAAFGSSVSSVAHAVALGRRATANSASAVPDASFISRSSSANTEMLGAPAASSNTIRRTLIDEPASVATFAAGGVVSSSPHRLPSLPPLAQAVTPAKPVSPAETGGGAPPSAFATGGVADKNPEFCLLTAAGLYAGGVATANVSRADSPAYIAIGGMASSPTDSASKRPVCLSTGGTASAPLSSTAIKAPEAYAVGGMASGPTPEVPRPWLHAANGATVGTDTVPAMLTPGEAVLNRGQQITAFGRPLTAADFPSLSSVSAGKRGNTPAHYATGGIASPSSAVFTLPDLRLPTFAPTPMLPTGLSRLDAPFADGRVADLLQQVAEGLRDGMHVTVNLEPEFNLRMPDGRVIARTLDDNTTLNRTGMKTPRQVGTTRR